MGSIEMEVSGEGLGCGLLLSLFGVLNGDGCLAGLEDTLVSMTYKRRTSRMSMSGTMHTFAAVNGGPTCLILR